MPYVQMQCREPSFAEQFWATLTITLLNERIILDICFLKCVSIPYGIAEPATSNLNANTREEAAV